MPIFILMIIAIIFFQVGASPTITVKPTHDDCKHVTVTRFFGYSTLIDAELCGNKTIDFNGTPIGGQ